METLYNQSKVFIIEKKVTASCLKFLKDNQYLTFELKGENVKDISSFLKHIVCKLPLDPPLDPNGLFNRDAFVDSLWGGLDNLLEYKGVNKVAFLWHDVDNMINFGFDDLIKLIESFNELICLLQSTEYGLSEPIDLLLCFTGNKDTLKRLKEVMTN